ncbi:MAG: hypothetical protein M0Z95_24710 [Actinomycetota bacterium]|nr:hypothetical protein [Actinomycetota bacterium]
MVDDEPDPVGDDLTDDDLTDDGVTGDDLTDDGVTGDDLTDDDVTDDDLGFDATGAEPMDLAAATAPRMRTGWQRLQESFFKPPPPRSPKTPPTPADFSKMTGAEIRARINQIDDTERKIGLAGAILAAIFALIFTVPYMVSKIAVATTVKPLHKTCADHLTYEANGKGPATCNGIYPPSHYVFPLVVWLVFALAIFVTVRIGRRAPVAFALVLTGLAFGTFIVIVPFLGAGGWLLLRAWRTQRYGSPTARAPVEGYVRPGPREPRGTRAGPGRNGRAGVGSTGLLSGSEATGSSGRGFLRRRPAEIPQQARSRPTPTANKRYTPKAPPKKKIPKAD